MNKRIQIYYNALFGALGGVVSWWLIGSLLTQGWNVWVAAAFVGSGLGLIMSACIAAADGAMIKRKPLRALRDGLIAGVAGLFSGALGMMLAQGVFLALLGGWVGRAFSWMILGLLIGLGDFLVYRRVERARYAALGGLAGGLAGGLLYEGLTQIFLSQSGVAQVFLSGLGLAIVGACIGALIPLARQVFAKGELHVLRGEQLGLVRELNDTATIGRYDGNDLYLPDTGVSWRHAVVRRTENGFELAVNESSEGPALLSGRSVRPGSSAPLQSGDQIQIGEAVLQFIGR